MIQIPRRAVETDQVFRVELGRNCSILFCFGLVLFACLFVVFKNIFYFTVFSCDKIDLGRTDRGKLAVAGHFLSNRFTAVETHNFFPCCLQLEIC